MSTDIFTPEPRKAHSDYGGSVAEKWIECPGYVNAVKDLPPSQDTIHTVSGTAMHALLERITLTGDDVHSWIGKPWIGKIPVEFKGECYGSDAIEAAAIWMDFIHEVCDPLLYRVRFEESVVMSSISEEIYGSADLVAVDFPGKHLVIADYKNGRKVVSPDSPQLFFYAVAAADTFGIELDASWRVTLAIVQPNVSDRPMTTETTGAIINECRGVLRRAFIVSKREYTPQIAGSHCGWCRAAGDCPAQASRTQAIARSAFAGVATVNGLTPEQRVKILKAAPQIEAFIADVKNISFMRAQAGQPDPGTMLTAGRRGNRKWVDGTAVEDALVQRFADAAFTKKLISPPDAEKIAGKGKLGDLEQFITQEDGKPSLTFVEAGKIPFDPNISAKLDFS